MMPGFTTLPSHYWGAGSPVYVELSRIVRWEERARPWGLRCFPEPVFGSILSTLVKFFVFPQVTASREIPTLSPRNSRDCLLLL